MKSCRPFKQSKATLNADKLLSHSGFRIEGIEKDSWWYNGGWVDTIRM